jgi:hypothetical protein
VRIASAALVAARFPVKWREGRVAARRDGLSFGPGPAPRMTAPNPRANDPPPPSEPGPETPFVPHAEPARRPAGASAGLPLRGRLRVPGDKSISHRAPIFGLLGIGRRASRGFSKARTCCATAPPAGRSCRTSCTTLRAAGAGARPRRRRARRSPAETLDFR